MPSPPRLVSCGENARFGLASSPLFPWGLGGLGRASRARRAHPGRCSLAAHQERPQRKIRFRVAAACVRIELADLETRRIRWMVGAVRATATFAVGILRLIG